MHEHRHTGVRRTGCKERLEKGSLLVKILAVSISWGSAFIVSIHTSAAVAFSICSRRLWSRQGIVACRQPCQYQPKPSKGSGRHVRDTTIQRDLSFISLAYSPPAWSFLSKIVNLLRTYTQIQLIIHAFYQWVNIWLVSIVSMVDSTTHLAFKTWRKSTDLSARVRIHRLLFVLTGWWWSLLPVCLALLAGLSSCTIKPLQMIQNAAARLVFSEPKRAHVHTSLCLPALAPGCSSHQVQDIDACNIEQPQAQHPPTSTHLWQSSSPQEVWDLLVSDASWCHHRETQNHSPEPFHSLFLAGGMNCPPPSGMLSLWQSSSDTLKTHLFHLHLTSASFYKKNALFP